MVRRVTGGPGSAGEKDKEVKKESSDSSAEDSQGLQVDFYLVIVSCRKLLFLLVKLIVSSSSLSLVSCLP